MCFKKHVLCKQQVINTKMEGIHVLALQNMERVRLILICLSSTCLFLTLVQLKQPVVYMHVIHISTIKLGHLYN